jgi:methionyl-tRNA formyltransferase
MQSNGNGDSWRVVLCTNYDASIVNWYQDYFARHGHRLVGVVTTAARPFGWLSVVQAAAPSMDVIVSSHARRWARMLAPVRPDLIVSQIFGKRIPQDVIDLPRLGTVNLHPSPLPKYRGTITPYWMLRHGERIWGASLHRTAREFDVGPLIAQACFEIDDNAYFEDIVPQFFAVQEPLWDAALPRIAAGDPGDTQDESLATYVGNVTDVDAARAIDWSLPAWEVHNTVRACDSLGGLGATAVLDGAPVVIHRTAYLSPQTEPSGSHGPGDIVSRDGPGLLVQCGDRPLLVTRFEPAPT